LIRGDPLIEPVLCNADKSMVTVWAVDEKASLGHHNESKENRHERWFKVCSTDGYNTVYSLQG
jgi:hypothetical protein